MGCSSPRGSLLPAQTPPEGRTDGQMDGRTRCTAGCLAAGTSSSGGGDTRATPTATAPVPWEPQAAGGRCQLRCCSGEEAQRRLTAGLQPQLLRVPPALLAKPFRVLKTNKRTKKHNFLIFFSRAKMKISPPMQPAPGSVPRGFVTQPQLRELPCSPQKCPISTSRQHKSCLQPEPLPWLLQRSAWKKINKK